MRRWISGVSTMLKTPPGPAMWLGASGLLPFFGLAFLALIGAPDWAATAVDGLLIYAATILAFMGGCRWGFAAAGLGEGPDWGPLAVSVLPSLWAWAVVWARPPLSDGFAALLLAIGFAALYWDDARATARHAAPAWWRALRAPLTVGACVALLSLQFR